jgi:hypothetical protein
MVMRYYFIVMLFTALFVSCTPKEKCNIKEFLIEDDYGMIYIPITIKAPEQKTTIVMVTLSGLSASLNIKILGSNKALGRLVYKSLEQYGYLLLDDDLYNTIKGSREVKNNHTVDSIYNSSGIEGVLYQYLDRYGRLTAPLDTSDLEYTYVTYLCFQHNVFFHWEDDELMGYFLSRGSDIDYDKVIQKLAATKEKDVPWAYWSENNEDDNAPLSLPKQDDNTLKN